MTKHRVGALLRNAAGLSTQPKALLDSWIGVQEMTSSTRSVKRGCNGTQQNVELYRLKRKQQTRLFQEKKRRLEEEDCQKMELLHRSQETRKFYQKLNASRNGFVPLTEMCRDKDRSILTDEREVIERWKQRYDQHLNGAVNTSIEGKGGEDDGYVSTADSRIQPAPRMRGVKDASPERLAACQKQNSK